MSIYGRVTKKDLRSAGRYLTMALIGVIIASLVNIFLRSSGLDWLLSLVTVGIFVGLTAYDTQKIKVMFQQNQHAGINDQTNKMALMGSLELYLDFINLFIYILRLLGNRK